MISIFQCFAKTRKDTSNWILFGAGNVQASTVIGNCMVLRRLAKVMLEFVSAAQGINRQLWSRALNWEVRHVNVRWSPLQHDFDTLKVQSFKMLVDSSCSSMAEQVQLSFCGSRSRTFRQATT